jgi:hypothetical protein
MNDGDIVDDFNGSVCLVQGGAGTGQSLAAGGTLVGTETHFPGAESVTNVSAQSTRAVSRLTHKNKKETVLLVKATASTTPLFGVNFGPKNFPMRNSYLRPCLLRTPMFSNKQYKLGLSL